MDLSLERDSTALGSLFQQIITDMKNTSPLWEDFVAKASKLHACLRAAIQAIAAYLDAFQKIADAATNSRGASKEIGTALTRVCLRHKAVETRMKTFTSAIMDCLILPLQDKLEDWKRQVVTLDKEHAKEYKRCRTELKKRSSDTLRLQKKARKGQSETIQSLVDSHMQDVTLRRAELEEVEKKSLRAAMVEERMRYCSFVNMLQPVVKEECEVMSELGHLQEAMQSIAVVTKEPNVLPQSSEELILESRSNINLYPESPGGNSGSQGCSNSLGSRKSSVCSISSMNSSGSSGSPGHHHYQRSLSQLISPAMRLKPGESSDSGFCSSPALTSQASTTISQSHAVSTWPPHSQDIVQTTDRPHTISSAYEKGHQRPALTVYTFQNPETIIEAQKSPAIMACRPPLPVRCSSLERPLSSTGARNAINVAQRHCPSPIPAHITKELPQHQPTYVNMSELASMAALKITNQQIQQQHQHVTQQPQQQQQPKPQFQQPQSNSANSPPQYTAPLQILSETPTTANNQSHNSSSGFSQPEGNATAIPQAVTGITPSSSGSPHSASQNYSPQLTSSPQNPLTGGSSCLANDNSNNKETCLENELKITETDTIVPNTPNLTNTPPNNQNSPADNEDISRGSVLEKTSMFEKLEQQQLVNNNPPPLTSARSSHSISANDCIYGSRKEDTLKPSVGANDKDSGCVTRIARRSSINSTKPPPPVRRSSSVTPSHNLTTPNSPNLIQQNVMNISAESLPPPPAYLLDRTTTASPTINVAETVKALTVIRHTPASPSALRRAQNHMNQTPQVQSNTQFNNTTNLFSPTNDGSVGSKHTTTTQPPPNSLTSNTCNDNINSSFKTSNSNSQGIYAQPKQVTKMSSFRSPGCQKTGSSFIAQLNARLTPSKQNQQVPQSSKENEYGNYHHTYQQSRNQTSTVQPTYSSGPNSPHHQNYVQPEQIYSRGGDRYYYGAQEYQQQQHCDDYAPSSNEKSGSIRAKTKAEFLENLNAKLAKQGLSGRAFAVRTLINSKALHYENLSKLHRNAKSMEPDPRLCHESLMDQIKRGATLKRNRTINDRSAPKIH